MVPGQAAKTRGKTDMIDAKSYGPWAIIAGASEGIGVSFAQQLGC